MKENKVQKNLVSLSNEKFESLFSNKLNEIRGGVKVKATYYFDQNGQKILD